MKIIFSILLAAILVAALPFGAMKVNAEPANEAQGMAVYAVKDGEVTEQKNEDVLYDIGNTSTIFIWLSIMKLKEEGKLELDKNALTYLPEDFSGKGKFKYDFTSTDRRISAGLSWQKPSFLRRGKTAS